MYMPTTCPSVCRIEVQQSRPPSTAVHCSCAPSLDIKEKFQIALANVHTSCDDDVTGLFLDVVQRQDTLVAFLARSDTPKITMGRIG